MPEVRTAVIGCGYWGKNLVRVFSDLRSLAAVCDTDEAHLAEWLEVEKEESALQTFVDKYIHGTRNFNEYLELCGGEKRMRELCALEPLKHCGEAA